MLSILDRLAAADGRLKVLHGEPLPPGWMGKAHAVTQAYAAAKGEWLLFTDADTQHAPWLLTSVMARLEHSPAAFATVFGRQRHPNVGVYLVNLAVLGYFFLMVDFSSLEKPKSYHSIVNGQYLIFARGPYESIGTHAAVRKFSSTDVSLGYLAKLQGWIPLVLDGHSGLSTTMYATAGDALRGWSRSLVNGAWTASGRKSGSLMLAIATAGMTLLWIAPLIVIWFAIAQGDAVALALSVPLVLAAFELIRLQNRSVLRPHGSRPWSTLVAMVAMPVSCAIFVAMTSAGLASAWTRGGTVWKGRVVRTFRRLPSWRPQPARPRS